MSFIYGLNIEGYKLFSEKVSFDFAPITILTGKNNSGKSTLSSAIRLLGSLFPEDISNREGFNEYHEGSIDIKKIIRPVTNDILPSNILYFKNLLPYTSDTNDISFEIPVNIGAFQFPQKLKLVYEISKELDGPLSLKELLIYVENEKEDWIYKIGREKEQYFQQINYRILLDDYRQFHKNYGEINKELKKLEKNYHIIPDENKLTLIKKKLNNLLGQSLDIYYDDEAKEFIIYDVNLVEYFPGSDQNYQLPEDYFLKYNVLFGFANPLNLLDYILVYPEKNFLNIDEIKKVVKSESSNINYLNELIIDDSKASAFQNDTLIDYMSKIKIDLTFEKSNWHQDNCLDSTKYFDFLKFLDIHFEKSSVRNRIKSIMDFKALDLHGFSECGHRFFAYYNNALRSVFKDSLCFSNIHHFNISNVELINNRYVLLDQLRNFKDEIINLINDDKSEEYKFICKWMKILETGDSFKIERDESFVKIKIIKDSKEFLISDNGYGHSKILPLLFKIVNIARNSKSKVVKKNKKISNLDYKSSILILEEPEIGLHPALQSKLAELFYDAFSKFNIQFIVETHSEYIVRKYQEMVVNPSCSMTKDYVQIHYFYHPDAVPEGELSQTFSIQIEEDGALTRNFGKGFFDESSNLNLAVYNYSKINQN